MPYYTYECVECEKQIEVEKPIEHRKEAETCRCGSAALLIITPVTGYVNGPAVPRGRGRYK